MRKIVATAGILAFLFSCTPNSKEERVENGLLLAILYILTGPSPEFEEHFSSALNDGIWQKADWNNGSPFNCRFDPSQVAVHSSGIASLYLRSGSASDSYLCGSIATISKFSYGTYTVRMKPAKGAGTVSSFFIYTGPAEGTIHDEIDIEFLGKDTTRVQFNYFRNGVGGHETLVSTGFDASLEFHEYTIEWRANSIKWYIDGNLKHEATTEIPVTSGKIMMNIWNGTGVDSWLDPFDDSVLPLESRYDFVKYYR